MGILDGIMPEGKTKTFEVKLEPALVNQAKAKLNGGSLSPVLNSLLKIWIYKRADVRKILTDLEKDSKRDDI